MCSRSNWDLELLAFKERGKPEYPEKNLSEQGREPTTTQPTCGVVVISSEDVCWNIRNVKLKFFSFQKCVYISLCLSPQFAFCFFLSWDGQKTRVSTIDNYSLLTIQGPLWLSLNRVEIKYSCFAVFFLIFQPRRTTSLKKLHHCTEFMFIDKCQIYDDVFRRNWNNPEFE